MTTLSRIWAIVEKDFQDSIKNRTVFFSIILPVLLSILFRMVLPSGDRVNLKLAVVNDKNCNLVNFINQGGGETIFAQNIESSGKAKRLVSEGKFHGALILPFDFEDKMKQGHTAKVDFWLDTNNFSQAAALEMTVNRIIYYYKDRKPPAIITINSVRGPQENKKLTFLPTWILFTVLGGFMVVASSILEEREKKTLQAIMTTPARLWEVLLGKGILGFFLTLSGGILILWLNGGFIGNPLSNISLIVLGAAYFSVLGILGGLLLPAQTTSNIFGSLLYMALFLPVVLGQSNSKMEFAAKFLPSYYLNDGINKAMFDSASFPELALHFGYLIITGFVLFLVSVAILRKKENL